MKPAQDDLAWRDAQSAPQSSEEPHPTVNLHNLAGDEGRARRAEKQHALRHIVRRAFTAQRRSLDNCLTPLRGIEALVKTRGNQPGGDAVDADTERPPSFASARV